METLPPSKRPSDRKFGFTFAAIFIAACAYGIFTGWRPAIIGLFALASVALLFLAALAPQSLSPLNKLWFAFGELLGKVVSPIVLGLIFFVLITPVSVISRLFGRDELKLKRRSTPSYWVPRQTSILDPSSFKQQF